MYHPGCLPARENPSQLKSEILMRSGDEIQNLKDYVMRLMADAYNLGWWRAMEEVEQDIEPSPSTRRQYLGTLMENKGDHLRGL